MKRNDLIVTILTVVLAFVLASHAQERPDGGQPAFQPQPGQPMAPDRPLPLIREYAQQLRERAREAQELADRLRREAEELEQMARQGPMLDIGPGPADPVRRELAEIKEAIGRAEREGRNEQAMDLRRRAEQLMDEMRSREKRPQKEEREFPEMREQIERLQNQAREAEAGGRGEEARRLHEEAENIEVKMQTEREIRDRAAQVEAMGDKVAALRKQAQQAKRNGRPDEAKVQWERADEIERQIGEMKRDIERFKVESQLKQVQMMAERAEKRGDMEKAEALAREARELKQHLQGLGPEKRPETRGDEMPSMVDELRQEVKRLRQEVQELKQQREREAR